MSKYLNTQGARLNVIDYHSEKQDKLYKTFESVKGLKPVIMDNEFYNEYLHGTAMVFERDIYNPKGE